MEWLWIELRGEGLDLRFVDRVHTGGEFLADVEILEIEACVLDVAPSGARRTRFVATNR